VWLLAAVASVSAASTITVKPDQSIQAAINKAPSGGLVVVERGTYKGNLEIKRSLRLVGHDAIIVPAAKPTPNICAPILQGGAGFRVVRVVTAHNGSFRMYIADVSNLSLLYNRAVDNGEDGFQVARSASSNAAIVGNASYGNHGTGILFLDSLGGRISLNTVYGNCSGIVVASVATPDVTPSGDVSIQLNQVTANNRMCPDQSANGGPPAYGGIGIGLVGARNTVVALNDVRGNVEQTGSGITGGGIVLLDGKMFGAPAPTGNSIRLNWLSGNTPHDINGDGTGTTNTVSGNTCTITNLTGAC